MVMTRQQRWLAAVAAEQIAQEPLSSRARKAAHWLASQVGGFTGQKLAKEVLKVTGVIAGVHATVRH
jgi:hypothetical protein